MIAYDIVALLGSLNNLGTNFNTYDLVNYYAIIQTSSEMKFDNYVNSYPSFKFFVKSFIVLPVILISLTPFFSCS